MPYSARMPQQLDVAYCTMEIGLSSAIPTFAGGLGMLAADIVRSCGDTGVSAACVTIRWRHGYPKQTLQPDGKILHEEYAWDPIAAGLREIPTRVTVHLEDRDVTVGAWILDLRGATATVPIIFLDTNLPENTQEDRMITRTLYDGGQDMRIKQEAILGIGGIRMLRALGYDQVGTYHMNEGHCAFLTLELLKERAFNDDAVRQSCAFTTHTPVPAGHDRFPYDLARRILGDTLPWHIQKLAGEESLSMTHLAMNLSRFTCGVSQIHRDVARAMLGNDAIGGITNGIHHPTWASPDMQRLFDTHLPGWRENPAALAAAANIPTDTLRATHDTAKNRLLAEINRRTGRTLDPATLLIVEARRLVPYKQPELLYDNEERLRHIGDGRLQIVHSSNSFFGDGFASHVIAHLADRGARFGDVLPVVYLPQYDPDLAALLVAGADVWLNTPVRRQEASGTSGMKAALNGTVNVSILDGWWAEAYAMDPESGWRIGPEHAAGTDDEMKRVDAEDLYTQLELEILPTFADPEAWAARMKRSIALIAQFNTHRCVAEYRAMAWHG